MEPLSASGLVSALETAEAYLRSLFMLVVILGALWTAFSLFRRS